MSLLLCAAAPAAATAGDLGAYMKARVADGDGRVDVAARGYARALDAAPDNPDIAMRAFREALAAGDDALADRAAAVLAKAGRAPADAAFLAIARAAAARDLAAERAAIAALDGPLGVLRPSLEAWAAFDRGEDGLPALDAAKRDPLAKRLAAETRALLLIAGGHTGEGIAAVAALAGADQAGVDLKVAAAQLLAHAGKAAEAQAMLAGPQPTFVALRERLGAGVAPGLAFGASRLFSRVAGELQAGDAGTLSIALTRAALRAEPGNDRARLLLAAALSAEGSPLRATAVLDKVPPDSAWAAAARAGRVQLLADAGEADNAIAAAHALADASDPRTSDIQRYADLLAGAGRFKDAVWQYRRVLDRGKPTDWAAWLQLGSALDQAGDWYHAEPALVRAVELAPDEPMALNYLGYARLDHGKDIAGATALIEKAARLKPNDAAITDSLAWAYFLDGQHARAVPLLERAAAGQPADPTINEHLGDAYWATGRRFEARYAWRAASLGADAAERARLAAKIADGPAARR